MLHNEVIRNLKVKGELIAFIPHRAYLIITGSKDVDGLKYALEIVDELMEDERALTSFAYIFHDNSWKVFEPREGHPLRKEIKERQAQSIELYQDMLDEE